MLDWLCSQRGSPTSYKYRDGGWDDGSGSSCSKVLFPSKMSCEVLKATQEFPFCIRTVIGRSLNISRIVMQTFRLYQVFQRCLIPIRIYNDDRSYRFFEVTKVSIEDKRPWESESSECWARRQPSFCPGNLKNWR